MIVQVKRNFLDLKPQTAYRYNQRTGKGFSKFQLQAHTVKKRSNWSSSASFPRIDIVEENVPYLICTMSIR